VISGEPRVGDRAIAEVDIERRHDIMRNHTATHLLHAALHAVLGPHAQQAGSLVAPDRLRFDFNHPEAMSRAQLGRVEQMVNDAIAADMEVMPVLKARQDAIAEGALALFGEKYGDTVRTVSIVSPGHEAPRSGARVLKESTGTASAVKLADKKPRYSYELCGGTHLERTSDVGAFLIVSEGSAAAGVRRLEAVTGRRAYSLIRHRFSALEQAAMALKCSADEVPGKLQSVLAELASVKRQLADSRRQQALTMLDSSLSNVESVGGVNSLVLHVPDVGVETLRVLADRFRQKYPDNGAAALASGSTLLVVVTEDLVKRGLRASDLIMAIGARGGGRANMAQGSLARDEQPTETLQRFRRELRTLVGVRGGP